MRSVLIVYASRYGATATAAGRLANLLEENQDTRVLLSEMAHVEPTQLEAVDLIVIGGPIYAGRIVADVPRFCDSQRETLLRSRVGLFITCLYEGDQARTQLGAAYPQWLQQHACAQADLGGAVRLRRLRFVDRFLMHSVARVRQDVDRIRMDAVSGFAAELRACLER